MTLLLTALLLRPFHKRHAVRVCLVLFFFLLLFLFLFLFFKKSEPPSPTPSPGGNRASNQVERKNTNQSSSVQRARRYIFMYSTVVHRHHPPPLSFSLKPPPPTLPTTLSCSWNLLPRRNELSMLPCVVWPSARERLAAGPLGVVAHAGFHLGAEVSDQAL